MENWSDSRTFVLYIVDASFPKSNMSSTYNTKKMIVLPLRVFGFVCYKHVPDAKRKKLDNRSRVMLFIGYHNTCAYKLYYHVTNKVEFNRDVIQKESEAWDWIKSQSNLVLCQLLKILQNLKMSHNQKMILKGTLKVCLTLKASLTLKVNLILI